MALEEDTSALELRFAKALSVLEQIGQEDLGMVPSNDEKLQLYGLYKQATVGPVSTPRPGIFDLVGRSKWDAWKKQYHLSPIQAKEAYVTVVADFLRKFPDRPLGAEVIEYFELSRAGLAPPYDSDDEHSDRGLDDVEVPVDVHFPESDHHSDDNLIGSPPRGFDGDDRHHPHPFHPHPGTADFLSASPPTITPLPSLSSSAGPIQQQQLPSNPRQQAPTEPRPSDDLTSTSRTPIVNDLIERVRALEVELSTMHSDLTTQRNHIHTVLRRQGRPGVVRAIIRTVLKLVASTCWNLICAFAALWVFGYRPTAQSKFVEWLIWMVMKRNQINGALLD
ncbi:acyl CoA binding protein-domain-containing protein [Fimicolochytrium jonesii]|uniref:acyl CoA binding protein-domain-containing protein n=1 Tax=Fimicolochytrium jonesii TaxID=1396493 RepID=UPI0022FE7D8C|nr:acyl CoA binding protein-domain-containing protein [Fimicolochytrium jonesii]KAI8819087.1 acyl CoA binding protein-domain-containing protein [Fimicolochytrium jonesii]